jgi:hypothetical protein
LFRSTFLAFSNFLFFVQAAAVVLGESWPSLRDGPDRSAGQQGQASASAGDTGTSVNRPKLTQGESTGQACRHIVGWVEFFTRPNIHWRGGDALGLARGSTQPTDCANLSAVPEAGDDG